ncbi:protein-s-isoprenylcysteine O-methyltransferase [Sparassis latifolia]|uniref:Protein-S-isoprenylcysteine O-methyltransferase n=1 Tax=Sparassis crispa TaxID=139825 RepID=A0A401GBZ9_9APHY|nr:Protein-S-isoprenylcysteine O-methyltransferase [Sparassis crispa]GBE79677.1 Protein-S-isoprenylcysteine O-methyltransferase [Sparassis crispa]
MSNAVNGDTDNFEQRLRQRAAAQSDPLSTTPSEPSLRPHGRIPNTPLAVSCISALLGILFALGAVIFVVGVRQDWSIDRLGFYIAAWAVFHWGEFAVTAGWNQNKCSIDSFLLENGAQYHIAHSVATLEYLISSYFWPSYKTYPFFSPAGIVLVIFGQILRSAAMIQAGNSFSHVVAYRKLDDHVLVTGGIYAWFRHPSYAGFYYWALGTQLLLQNPISFVGFAVVLWRFFSNRIAHEEISLIRFFGDDYNSYRSRTGTMIPFVS